MAEELKVDDVMGGDELGSLTKDPKVVEDYSKLTDTALANAEALVKAGKVEEAILEILATEKKARQACDAISASKLASQVLRICKNSKNWIGLSEYIILLSKKRGQLKRVIIDIVQLAMSMLPDTPDKPTKLALIETLTQVTDGKIFVEVERARIVMILAKIKESEGDIDAAATALEEVQVETFGAMERREKAEYILEQMRIVLAKGDFIRCQIISKKINVKLLEPEDFQDIKIKYNEFMIQYYLHEGDYLSVAKCYHAVFSTPNVYKDAELSKKNLKAYIMFLILSPFSNEQSDLLNRVVSTESSKLLSLPVYKRLLNDALTLDLMKWPLPYENELKEFFVFRSDVNVGGEERWRLLETRVLQLNIRTMAAYYRRMKLDRAAELLGVGRAAVETQIAELVTSGFLKAKMDRPAGIVTFGGKKGTDDVLNEWSSDIRRVLDLLGESCHLVEKERMIQAAKSKRQTA